MWPPTPDHARRLQPTLDAEMERRLHERRIHIDKIACVVAFLQIAMGALDAVSRSGCRTLLFGSLALHAAHAWWIFGPRAQWYSTHRTLVAAGLMVVVRLLTALSIQGCNNPTSRDDGVTLTFRLLYKTGFVPLVWYYVAVPLPFGQAVLFHILSTVLYNRTLVVHACTRVFTLPGDEALLRGAWRAITLLVGISSPMQGGLLAPSFGPDEDLQLDDDGSLSGLGFGGSSPARCGNATNEWPSLASGGVTGGVTSDQGSCPAAVSHGQVCVATMTFAQVVLGLWLPFVLSYVMLLRMRRRLLKDHMLDWESEQEVALQLQRRRQQQLAYAAAAAAAGTPVGPAGAWEGGAGVGGGGGGDGGGAGSWLAMALESCHVSPLALLLFTVAVSNMTYWAVVGAWSL